MKNTFLPGIIPSIFGLFIAILLANCVTPFESARMIPKGQVELKGSYTHVRGYQDGENDKINDGFGIGLGFGVSKRVNLKFRYERLNFEGDGLNFLAFGPKFALKKDAIALAIPIWTYPYDNVFTWGISPTMLFRVTPPSDKIETTLGFRADVPFEDDTEMLVAANIGFGLSKDLNRWAIRPDLGFVFNPGEKGAILTFGVGFQGIISYDNTK